MQFQDLTIGIPREILKNEKRVAATPETAGKMTAGGARVLVETGAGNNAFISDEEYREKGAEICTDSREMYQQCHIILKVKEPRYNEELQKHEAELFPENGTLISFLHPANPVNHESLKIMAQRGITGFTLDGIPRISRAQHMDTLTAMSTVAGYKSVFFAANNLGRFIPMMPTSSGIIKPAQFLIVGSGVAGLQAIANAKRLGAKVKTIDIRPEANEQARSLGAEVIEFNVPKELAVGEGGYARRLTEEWYERERQVLSHHVAQSDVVILTALIPGEVAPRLVDEEMVKSMKKGSTIIDVAVDQGGNCSLTHPGEEYRWNGITISGILNMPATLPIDATKMFSDSTFNFLSYLVKNGNINHDTTDEIIHSTLVTHENRIIHEGTLKSMEKYK